MSPLVEALVSAATERVKAALGPAARVTKSGSGYMARCPAHDDQTGSLSIKEGNDGRVLLKCFAGCEFGAILRAIGMTASDTFERPARSKTKVALPPRNAATVQQSIQVIEEKTTKCRKAEVNTLRHRNGRAEVPLEGCTVAQYAAAKLLDVETLRSYGLRDVPYRDPRTEAMVPAVRIPYLDEAGVEVAVQHRVGLRKSTDGPDNRFRFAKGSHPCLYGRDRVATARKAGEVVLVEGASDAHTLWSAGFNAVAVAGASSWNGERDSAVLDDIARVYLVVEPDKGGESLVAAISKSKIKDRVLVVRLDGFKDPSDMYLAAPKHFAERFRAALDAAVPLVEVEAKAVEATKADAWAQCKALAESPRILDLVVEELHHRGVVGEDRVGRLIYLVVTSRLLGRPISAAVKGPSSAGKSFIVERVLDLFPPTAYYALTSMSERALAYSEEPLVHRVLVLFEAAGMTGDFASYLIRSLLSEGCIRYETVEKAGGGLRPRLIYREGPTGLLTTTTKSSLHPENETRMLSVTVSDRQAQTRSILAALARQHQDAPRPTADPARWQALQTWVELSDRRVVIPFAQRLAGLVPPVAVRLRRDFKALLGLVSTHAILHQATRERDQEGRIVATVGDYEVVREIIADIISEGVAVGVSPTTRETVEAVRRLLGPAPAEEQAVSQAAVARELNLDKSATSRRVRGAVDAGYLVNLEDRKGRHARLKLGEALPEDAELLPRPEVLVGSVAATVPAATEPAGRVSEFASSTSGECCSVAGGSWGEEDTIPPSRSSDARAAVDSEVF